MLSKIDTKFEQNMEGLLVREEMGIIPPTFVIDKSIEIMQDFVDMDGPSHRVVDLRMTGNRE